MRQAEIVVSLTECQLVVETRFRFGQLDDLASQSGDMLANGEVEPFDEGRVDLLTDTTVLEHGFHRFQVAVDDTMDDADHPAFLSFLDQLGLGGLPRRCRWGTDTHSPKWVSRA